MNFDLNMVAPATTGAGLAWPDLPRIGIDRF
jgi:hypothetical protein